MKKNIKLKSNLKRKRKHGFRVRSKSKGGQAILNRKRSKGQKVLSA
ncbi:MAG: 50S ribosomal protein L34 [Candidatus Omnitrophota bacterium]